MIEKIKAFFSTINKKDAIILGVLALIVIGIVIALIVFVAMNWKLIVGIGIASAVVAGAVFFIIKYLKSKTA